MATSEAQRASLRRYYMKNRDKKKAFLIRFDKEQDADVIEAIEKSGNKTDYVRQLVRGSLNG
jgi:predicted CopG family antitoxin